MPARRYHEIFDRVLARLGVLVEGRDASSVHDFLDAGAAVFGAAHRELDPGHHEDAVRRWIDGLPRIRQDTATDYVRAACAHRALDDVVSSEKDRLQRETGRRPADAELNWETLHTRAVRTVGRRRCDGMVYRRGRKK